MAAIIDPKLASSSGHDARNTESKSISWRSPTFTPKNTLQVHAKFISKSSFKKS
jgi:hypothetical protein